MTLPDKIKALPLPPVFAHAWLYGESHHVYTIDQMRALLDAAATLAAEHEARAQAMADALRLTCDALNTLGHASDRDVSPEIWREAQAFAAEEAGESALRAWKESQ